MSIDGKSASIVADLARESGMDAMGYWHNEVMFEAATHIHEQAGVLRRAADEIERLRAVCGSMDDASRVSKFEWGVRDRASGEVWQYSTNGEALARQAAFKHPDLYEVAVRTVTTTNWRPV